MIHLRLSQLPLRRWSSGPVLQLRTVTPFRFKSKLLVSNFAPPFATAISTFSTTPSTPAPSTPPPTSPFSASPPSSDEAKAKATSVKGKADAYEFEAKPAGFDTLKDALQYAWPKTGEGKARLAAAMGLMAGAKLLNVQVCPSTLFWRFSFDCLFDVFLLKLRPGCLHTLLMNSLFYMPCPVYIHSTQHDPRFPPSTIQVPLFFKHAVDSLGMAAADPNLVVAVPFSLLLGYGAARASMSLMHEMRAVIFAKVQQVAIRYWPCELPINPCNCLETV